MYSFVFVLSAGAMLPPSRLLHISNSSMFFTLPPSTQSPSTPSWIFLFSCLSTSKISPLNLNSNQINNPSFSDSFLLYLYPAVPHFSLAGASPRATNSSHLFPPPPFLLRPCLAHLAKPSVLCPVTNTSLVLMLTAPNTLCVRASSHS